MTLEEQTAKAIYEARNGRGAVPWNHQPKGHRDPYLADARAAIAIISEEAAKVAENAMIEADDGEEPGDDDGEEPGDDDWWTRSAANGQATVIAKSIRALSEDRP